MTTKNRTSARKTGWQKQFAATCLGAAAALCATQAHALDYHFWTGGAGDFLFSSVGNWSSGKSPAADPANAVLAICNCNGQTLTNDLPFAPYHCFSQSDSKTSCVITGDPIGIANHIDNSADIEDCVSEQVYDLPVTFTGQAKGRSSYVNANAKTRIAFTKPITVAAATDTTDAWVEFVGAGTNVLGGGIVAEAGAFLDPNTTLASSLTQFKTGTTIISGEVTLPSWYIHDGAHVIVTNGTLKGGWADVYTYTHTCTIDLLAGGRFTGGSSSAYHLLLAQGGAGYVTTLNVYDGGWLDNAAGRIRMSDDGMTYVNVYDGGRVDWKADNWFSNSGATRLSIFGGDFYAYPLGVRMYVGSYRGKNAGLADHDGIAFKGGTVHVAGFIDVTKVENADNFDVDFDGGTLAANCDTTAFFDLDAGSAYASFDTYVARVLAGGVVFDTCGHTVAWGGLSLAGEGETDGGFTKRGPGSLTLDAACTYVGPTRVEAGTFVLAASSASKSLVLANGTSAAISDASYFTGALDLASSSALSFGGNALSVTSLASDGGRIRLTLAADDAGQRVAATSTSFEGDGLRFELVDADGAAWSANGTYTLLTQTGLDASAANAVSVANPVAGKTYAFAVADGALQVTIADGDTPANTLIATSDTTLSDSLDVTGTLYVHVAEGCTLTLAGDVTAGEDAKIVVYGPGALAFAAANAVPVEVRDGATVSISAATALAGGIALDAGTTLSAADDVDLDCTVDAAAGASFTAAEGKTFDLSGATLPQGGYVVAGAGRVKMPNAEVVVPVVSGTLVLDAAPAAPLALAGGDVVYAGESDAAFTQPISLVQFTGNAFDVSLADGAGDVTLDCAFSTLYAFDAFFRTTPYNEFVFRDATFDFFRHFDGSQKLRFGAGNFRFVDGFSCEIPSSSTATAFAFGEDNENRQGATRVTIEEGANLDVAGVELVPQAHGKTDSDVTIAQNGGTVKIRKGNAVSFGTSARLTNKATYSLADGTFDASGAKCDFIAGDAALDVSGGDMKFGRFALGKCGGSDSSYCDDVLWQGYRQSIDVSGGALSFLDGFSWMSCYDFVLRRLLVTVRGEGSLALPATTTERDSERERYPIVQSTLALDGGRFAVGAGDDALNGLDELVVGAGGARILAAADATVSQRLRGTATTGGIVKEGPGKLAFTAKDNALFGDVDVREGTLALGLSSQPQKPWPHGLVALWDFDGDEPLKDKTGHGLDLVQLHEAEYPVSITAGNDADGVAHDGTSAYWPVCGGSFGMTNDVGFCFNAHTVSFWTRLKNFSQQRGLICFMSTRSGLQQESALVNNNWCLCLNGGERRFDGESTMYNGVCTEDVDEYFTLGEWHMVTQVREGLNDWEYIDGEPVRWDTVGMAKIGKTDGIKDGYQRVWFKTSDAILTIGQTYGGFGQGNEYINAGAMMDDVAIFSRALSAEEVKALYEQSAAPAATLKPAVKVASGATWDMCGTSLSTDLLVGGGSVVNGALSIAGTIKLEADAAAHVATPVFPSADVTVDLGCDADEPAAYGRYVVLSYDELDADSAANVALWKVTGTGRAKFRGRAVFSVDAAAKQVVLDLEPPGTVLIVK